MFSKKSLAFAFPGQGSQKVGMLAEFASNNSTFNNTFAEASAVLGYDLWQLIQTGPQDKINMTEIAQPALLTCSVALWRLWCEQDGAKPSLMTGHSLGEWSALVCAQCMSFSDAVRLVRLRGKYMQEAVAPGVGAMAAIIGLEDAQVEDACRQVTSAGGIVSAVNYNSPGQLVIAGEAEAVASAIELCKKANAKRAMPLPVSAPFHTMLMKPAADNLAEEIFNTQFQVPNVPVVHNVTATAENDPQKIKTLLVEQIYSAVRWVDCVKYTTATGVTDIVECGPGKVLAGLIKRIDKKLTAHTTDTEASFATSIASVGA